MKILFVGDYSNLHASLAAELRRQGHICHVLSDGGAYMQTQVDFFAERTPGFKGGMQYLLRLFSLLPQLKGYDAVQLVNSNFLKLRPGKIRWFFNKLRSQNGRMFLSLAGNDYFFVKACADAEMFRFSEFKTGKEENEYVRRNPGFMKGWISDVNRIWSEELYGEIDGAMSVLPEYDMAARPVLGDRLTFTNLPVDLSLLHFSPLDTGGPLRIFTGIKGGMEIQKGTERLHGIAKELEREMPGKVVAESVRNLSLREYLLRMKESHVVLDQRYSYSPALNALQAMAMGRIAGTGAEPEYWHAIGDPEEKPVFKLSPLVTDSEIKETLRSWALDRTPLLEMSLQGRRLVETHNDIQAVSSRFLSVWQK